MKLFCLRLLLVCTIFACSLKLSYGFVGEKLLTAAGLVSNKASYKEPLMVRAARGEPVERVPVWIMRQAGRHMKVYRDLVKKHPTFRERSENVDLSTEISLQPVRAYDVDGCILFSDILTPLPAMGVEFDILEGKGPVIANAQRYTTKSGVEKHVKPIDLENNLQFVGETLQKLRKEMHGTDKAVLGFVGLPFTLAAYMIEGGSSKDYGKIKKFLFEKPDIAHLLLRKLADNIVDYTKYQIENGAQIVQLFDSWAAHLTPNEYNAFAAHYHKYIIDRVKKTYPDVPLILFVHKGVGSYLDQIQESGADIVSIDWTVNAKDIRNRLDTSKMIKNMQAQFLQGKDKVGNKNLIEKDMGIQGNLDPMILHTNKDIIERETKKILDQLNGKNHIMNLGHGIDSTTKEENVKHFVNYVRNYKIKK